jgi:hypothetical protein
MANDRKIASHQEMLRKAASTEAPSIKPPMAKPDVYVGKEPYVNADRKGSGLP